MNTEGKRHTHISEDCSNEKTPFRERVHCKCSVCSRGGEAEEDTGPAVMELTKQGERNKIKLKSIQRQTTELGCCFEGRSGGY